MRNLRVALLSSALSATALGPAIARPRALTPAYGYSLPPPPQMFEGRSAWAAGRSRGGAACTIYSCPRSFAPGVPLNPEGNLRPGGIP